MNCSPRPLSARNGRRGGGGVDQLLTKTLSAHNGRGARSIAHHDSSLLEEMGDIFS